MRRIPCKGLNEEGVEPAGGRELGLAGSERPQKRLINNPPKKDAKSGDMRESVPFFVEVHPCLRRHYVEAVYRNILAAPQGTYGVGPS